MPETDTHREDIFLRKLMNKANIGWWEADVKQSVTNAPAS